MKKIFIFILALFIFCSSALAGSVDLTGLSFDELVSLREQIDLAIWNSQEWQEVEVPAGVWIVGVDIPSGHWTITIVDNAIGNITYADVLDEYGKRPGKDWQGYSEILNSSRKSDGSYYYPAEPKSFDLDMKSGMYFINNAPVIFTPYAGKPDLSFK